jgi:triacylglycerol esterase/lipase EstA (alpha/beta hydrolase family)
MRTRSALARLQQAVTLGLLGLAAWWAAWRAPASPTLAVLGALAIFFSYSFVLALEFILVKIVARRDPAPPPAARELLRAWWAETWVALAVFFWRQPFRWRAHPDFVDASMRGRRGVVLVHGFMCNRGLWNPWMARLRAAGHPFIAINLEPVLGPIEAYGALIEAAVQRLAQATGERPLIVAHSMGGLAVRAWLRTAGAGASVHRVITIGTPHRGTWLGRFSHTANGRQMRLDSEWIRTLAQERLAAPFTCWYSNCDNVVFPPSVATLPGADNRFVRGVAHVELAFDERVFAQALEILRG